MASEIELKNSSLGAVSAVPPATGSSNINIGPTERIISAFAGAAATFYGLRRGNTGLALAGAYLLVRGASGYCAVNNAIGRNTAVKRSSAMDVKGTLTVNKPRAEVYAFWRRLENLPQFMKHLEEVVDKDGTRSTWKANIPGDVASVTWEAEITEDRPGELIRWSSLPGSTIDNAGEVSFDDAAGGEGTQITALITYRLPAGDIGSVAAKLFNPAIEKMMQDDLERFKQILETGASNTENSGSSSLTDSLEGIADEANSMVEETTKTKKGRGRKKASPENPISSEMPDADMSTRSVDKPATGTPGLGTSISSPGPGDLGADL